MSTHKIGFVLTGGFKKLAPHVGALYRYKEEEDAGKIARPEFVIGASAGAIAVVSCFSPWHYKNIQVVGDLVRRLTKDQIFSYHFWMESAGILTVAEDFVLPFFPKGSTVKRRALFEIFKSGLSLGTKALLAYELLEKQSIFSNRPLYNLLKKNLKPEFFWKAGTPGPNCVKLEIPAVNLATAQEWIFTNYLPEHRNLAKRDEYLIKAVMASASVPVCFPPEKIDSYLLDDAALKINAPLHRAVLADCDTIFVFLHSQDFTETVPLPKKWTEDLNRELDIAINESTRKTIEGHQDTNQNLKTAEESEGLLQEAEGLLEKEKNAGELRIILLQLKEKMKNYTFYGRKKTNLILVVANEKIPNLYIADFNQEQLTESIAIGYRAMDKALKDFHQKNNQTN